MRAVEKLPSLDGWRAIAILLVLYSHGSLTNGAEASGLFPGSLMFLGEFGVRIFFVISGFLITHLLLMEWKFTGGVSLKMFYLRRALRIFPLYFLYLAVLALLTIAGLYSDSWSNWIGSLTFTRNIIGRGQGATAHLWSLAVEEQFYVIWPSMLALLGLAVRYRRGLVTLWAVMAISFLLRLPSCDDQSFTCLRVIGSRSVFHYGDHLAAGAIAAFLYTRWRWSLAPALATVALVAFISILGLSVYIDEVSSTLLVKSAALSLQALSISAAVTVTVAAKPWGVFSALNARPLVYIGLLSYSLYIWHLLFVAGSVGPELSQSILYDWRIWWIPSFVAAMTSYHLMELPLARLRNRFRPVVRGS